MPEQRKQLLPFAALSASYFAHIGFFNPYLPLWLKELGFGLLAISVLTSVQSGTRLFAPYAWGWLSDHTGERVKLLRYGATAALLLSIGLWFPLGGMALFVVLLLMFSHTSAMMPMSEAALAHLVSQGGAFDAQRYGRVRLWGSLGFLITVLAAGVWFEYRGLGDFPVWTSLSLLAVTASVWWLPDHKDALPPHEVKPSVKPVLRQPAVRWFFAALFFHVLSHIFIYIFFSLYLDSLGYSKTTIGLLWAVSVIIEIGWFFTQGRWLPRLSLTGWLLLAAVLMVLRMGLTAGLPELLWVLFVARPTARARAGALQPDRLRLARRHRRAGRRPAVVTPGFVQRVLGIGWVCDRGRTVRLAPGAAGAPPGHLIAQALVWASSPSLPSRKSASAW